MVHNITKVEAIQRLTELGLIKVAPIKEDEVIILLTNEGFWELIEHALFEKNGDTWSQSVKLPESSGSKQAGQKGKTYISGCKQRS